LLAAGGDDVLAVEVGGSVVEIRILLRILFFVAPAVTGVVVYLLCARKRRQHARSEASSGARPVLRNDPRLGAQGEAPTAGSV
jgi:hypothetical protein